MSSPVLSFSREDPSQSGSVLVSVLVVVTPRVMLLLDHQLPVLEQSRLKEREIPHATFDKLIQADEFMTAL